MKKKMRFVSLLLFTLILSACGSNAADNQIQNFDTVYGAVENAFIDVLVEESDMTEEDILNGYFIEDLSSTEEDEDHMGAKVVFERMELDEKLLANGKVIAAMMNVNADEIFLLEAKTADDVEAIKESLERELEGQIQTWEHYLPDQYEKVRNNTIEINGKFLLYVTFSEPDEIVQAFKSQF